MEKLEWLQEEIEFAVNKVRENLKTFQETVPPAASEGLVYPEEENIDWTASFWVGMLFLAKELTNATEFDATIEKQMAF
ncbi:hypothetical protein K4E_22310 [Enterococcus thailandicus]|nr:hypothetical protein K4E_22310 [Enterococcus thailandicus]